ncbi:MAG: 3-oxoacyl-[acyl-carrier-protein] reductase [Acidobacteria bacterium]|nr:MAG: 3-oxoacyl-[acyl-carrier-protein] reductase [Acidobacteriota bacterium]MCE7957188.1 3-oxoacyl-[acyl-carrier-protein] reductase [Acidobacteria bacterium ACB2]
MAVTVSLAGKVALVTGGSQGIGEAICRKLAAAGAHVLVAARTAAKAGEVAESLRQAGGSAEALALDVSDPASVSAAFKGIAERHGRLDVLVNNAGITEDGLLLRMSREAWDRVLGTDLTGVFLVTQEAVKLMMKKRIAGRVVSVTSVVGLMGNAGQTNYAAAKAGVEGFTKALAREIGSRGITVNAVAPGYVETAMTARLSEEQRKALEGKIVLGRLGTGEDVAAAVLYLASDEASYVTGACLNVSGGLYIG